MYLKRYNVENMLKLPLKQNLLYKQNYLFIFI